MTRVRFTEPQATPDGMKAAGVEADVPDHLARKYVDFGRAEVIEGQTPRRRGRPRKEQARTIDRADIETR